MTRGERRFLWLTPVPLVLTFYHIIGFVKWFRPAIQWLGWLPQTIGIGLSLVLMVVGIRYVIRALRARRLRDASILFVGTLVGGIAGFGLIAMFFLISLNLFSIHQ
jgi:hypothetical protein